jgi:hypothetical protein
MKLDISLKNISSKVMTKKRIHIQQIREASNIIR